MQSNQDIIGTLNPAAAAAAQKLCDAFTDVMLTSGKRSVGDQARAMAGDVAKDPQFIAKTYRKPLCPAAAACQDWVNAQLYCVDILTISAGLLAVLQTFSQAELDKLSFHFSGDAFDIRPDGDPKKLAFLQDLASQIGATALFLENEGGLVRWHFQVKST